LLAPCPTPTLEDQASVFISLRGRVAQLYPQTRGTHFSRLLQHTWVTVGLYSPLTTRRTEVSLSFSKVPATGLCTVPEKSSPHLHSYRLNIPSNIIHSFTPLYLK
jgi:hypothetical protein